MTKRFFLSFALTAAVVITADAQKIAVTKGQKLETVATTKMTMEMMGQNINNESGATTDIEVKDVNADGFLFTSIIKRMTTKVSGMGQDISFDSDKKEDMDGQIGQALKDQINVQQEIQVDQKGKVISTTGSNDKKTGGMTDMMSITGDVTKGQPYPVLIQLPAKSIKPGDTWVDSSGTAATIKTITTYTLMQINADGALVSFSGTLVKNGTIEQNGMEIQMDMSGTTKGEATYEPSTGLLKTSSTTSDIKGTLGIMGQNAPLSATITANVVAKKM